MTKQIPDELYDAFMNFYDYYWNHTGTYEYPDNYKYSLIENTDMVELDERAAKIEELLVSENGGTK